MKSGLNLQIAHKGIILVSVPLILELVFIAILSILLRQAEVEVQRQIRSKAIISQANALSKLFYDAGVAMGGYSITKSPLFSDRYDKIVRQIPEDLTELKSLVGDNQRQQQILKNLALITETGLKILGEAKGAIDDNQVDVAQFRARHMYKEIRSLADRLQEELHGLTEDEQKIANMTPEAQNRSRSMVKYYLVVGVIFNVLLAFGLAAFFSRGITGRLRVLTDNSMRLARGDPLNPLLGGADEIAMLDETFHSMADALMEANRKERAIIENAVDVICSIDVDGKFVAVSPAARNTWGYEPEELIGRRFIELVLPADHQETIRAVRAVRAERGTMNFENRTRRKDGSLVTILWSTFWSESERSMFCVAHDITQRKLAEEAVKASERRVRMIIENMLGGLITITTDGIIESINPASERMFGYRQEELIGQHIMAIFQDSTIFSVDNEQDRRNFMDGLMQKSYNRIGELDALKKIGESFPIEISLGDLETADGPRLLANILDVSERREVERLKKEFVSTVSHELRTPLTSIRGSLTLLNVGALGNLPEQAKKVVGIAERNTIRLITLINDILDIEKLESGKLDMVFDTIQMSNVLERSAESVKAFAEQNGIRLDMVPSTAKVYADGDRLVQVLVNLVSNAVKFSPKGETVTVQVDEIPNWIEVKVIDHGRGIPAKFKNALFQRFQQVEASDAKKKGGTGLGLAICKGIIEAHGGNIGVESEEGKGSIFWFRIPPAVRTGTPGASIPPGANIATAPSAQSMTGQQATYQGTSGSVPAVAFNSVQGGFTTQSNPTWQQSPGQTTGGGWQNSGQSPGQNPGQNPGQVPGQIPGQSTGGGWQTQNTGQLPGQSTGGGWQQPNAGQIPGQSTSPGWQNPGQAGAQFNQNGMTNPNMGMGMSMQNTGSVLPLPNAPPQAMPSPGMQMNGMTNPNLSMPMPGNQDPWMEASRTTLGGNEVQKMRNTSGQQPPGGWPAPSNNNSNLGSHQGYLQNMTGPLPNQMPSPLQPPGQNPASNPNQQAGQQRPIQPGNAPPQAMSPQMAAHGMSWLPPEMIANSSVSPGGPAPNQPNQPNLPNSGPNPWLAQQKPGWQQGMTGQNPNQQPGQLPPQKKDEEKWS